MNGLDIIAAARGWIGTPWRHQASLKGVGCDCIGLFAGVAAELGCSEASAFLGDPNLRCYGRQPERRQLLAGCARFLDETPEAFPGDLLMMRFQTDPQHFAILSTPDRIIHASATAGKVVEHQLDDLWRRRVVRFYRLRGLA